MGRVSIAIQHHPARADMIGPLLDRIGGDVEVVTDPEPDGFRSPWRTYREALERTPDGVTHRLILQDDVTVCDGFADAVELASASRPLRLLTLFHGGQPRQNLPRIERGLAARQTWVAIDIRRWVPVVALMWPVHVIRPALDWIDEQHYPVRLRADDEIVGRAMNALGETVLACVPSIVQHEDMVPSLLGLRAKQGADRARVAYKFTDDPSGIDWSAGDR